jgi:4-amino-4-deoxy-L-arabinose transferase-like glycosyltransferase
MSNIQHPMNSRFQALVIVLLVWAVVYLPALGSLAVKGEEGRRILPAIEMLKTGDMLCRKWAAILISESPPW